MTRFTVPSPRWGALGAALVLLLNGSFVRAQDDLRDVVDQQMSWYMLFGNHRLTDDLGLHTEYQFRRTGLGPIGSSRCCGLDSIGTATTNTL